MTVFPSTLSEWLEFLVHLGIVLGAAGGFAWAVIRAPLVNQINGLGERVNDVEVGSTKHEANIQSLQRAKERSEFDRSALHERFGKLEGLFSRMVEAQDKAREDRHKNEQDMRDRLARIETKVDDLRRENGRK